METTKLETTGPTSKILKPGGVYNVSVMGGVSSYFPWDALFRDFVLSLQHQSVLSLAHNCELIEEFAKTHTKDVSILESAKRVAKQPYSDRAINLLGGTKFLVLDSYYIPVDFVTEISTSGFGDLSYLETQDIPVILRSLVRRNATDIKSRVRAQGGSEAQAERFCDALRLSLMYYPWLHYHKILYAENTLYLSGIRDYCWFSEVTREPEIRPRQMDEKEEREQIANLINGMIDASEAEYQAKKG